MPSLSSILCKGRAMFLAYDQGFDHGPSRDFNEKNVDPLYILDIAKKGKFTAVIFHVGVAEKYKKEIKKSGVPLIVKLNGRTQIAKGEPIARQDCTVKEAKKLGASAVGYTIYIGSEHESEMIDEFADIRREAHAAGLSVVLWCYPRGKAVKKDDSREMMAQAARVGLELGADVVKIKSNRKISDLKWAVKSAGRCKLVVAGGGKVSEKEFIKEVEDIMKAGAAGLAVGRNVWQDKKPVEVAKEIRKVIWG